MKPTIKKGNVVRIGNSKDCARLLKILDGCQIFDPKTMAALLTNDNPRCRELAIKSCMRGVFNLASYLKPNKDEFFSIEDVFQAGMEHACKYAERYDPNKNGSFFNYFSTCAYYGMITFKRRHNKFVELTLNHSYHKKINELRKSVTADLTLEDLVVDQGDELFYIFYSTKFGERVELDEPIVIEEAEEKGTATWERMINNFGSDSDDTISNIDRPYLQQLILNIIDSKLTVREKQVITLFFGIGCDPLTLEEISERLDLVRERCRQLKEKAMKRLSHLICSKKWNNSLNEYARIRFHSNSWR